MNLRVASWFCVSLALALTTVSCGGGRVGQPDGAGGDVDAARPLEGAPVLLYTDIVAGSTTGGENGDGAYLSLYGLALGSEGELGVSTHVFIGADEVAAYRFLGAARAQHLGAGLLVQQLTVQVGALPSATPGTPAPIRIEVAGLSSNTNHTFTVQPGNFFFVDNVSGNDATGVVNDVGHPFRHVQLPDRSGALGLVAPGDTVVMRGGLWRDVGYGNRFARFIGLAGNAPTGASGHGYIAVMAYPGEDVHVLPADGTQGGFHGVGDGFEPDADWITISNLRIEGGNDTVTDGPINLQVKSDHWRIVGNELFDWLAGTNARAGGITGNGTDVRILGNAIHGIGGGTLNHGIYLDTGATDVEIAYNHIYNVTGGNLVQAFDNLGTAVLNDIAIHHNRLHDTTRYGLNISGGTNRARAWNNLVYDTDFAGIRLATPNPERIEIYYNTLQNNNRADNHGPFQNDEALDTGSVSFGHNIVVAGGNATQYVYNASSGAALAVTRNLWFGRASGAPPQDSDPVGGGDAAAPGFADAAAGDFHLLPQSPAVDQATAPVPFAVGDDFEADHRPSGAAPDVGADEL